VLAARDDGVVSLVERDRAVLWHPYAPVDPTLPLWEVEAAAGGEVEADGGRGRGLRIRATFPA